MDPVSIISFDLRTDFRGYMASPLRVLTRKLKEHTQLGGEDAALIEGLSHSLRHLQPGEDLIRQGDHPAVSAVVIEGVIARYHLLPAGARQYLSFHMAGDMPDSQSLFIERMDHAVCAMGPAKVALITHKALLTTFERRPALGFAIWRETLIDAAIFREAVTNNSARKPRARLGHLFCELFYRARASGLTIENSCSVPISLMQLGNTLGMSIATVNRTLQQLRASRSCSFERGQLQIHNWDAIVRLSQFNPEYLHQRKPPPL
jgi:CRP-like cAMP-binding protein